MSSLPNTCVLQLILKKSLKLEDEERCAGQGILTIGFAPEELEKIQKTITLWSDLMDIQTKEHQELKDRYNTCKMSMKLKDNEITELEDYKEKYYNARYNNDEDWEFVGKSGSNNIVENDDGFKEVHIEFTMGGFSNPVKYIITPKKYYFVGGLGKKEVYNIIQSNCGDYLGHDIDNVEDDEILLQYDEMIECC